MSYIEKEKLIKADIASIENRVRHAFNQGYDLGYKDGKSKQLNCSEIPTGSTTKNDSPKYCDRSICLKNEYNNVGCEDCEVTKSQEPTTKNDLGVDCISRKEVLRLLANSIGKTNTYLQTKVLKMPSVTPQLRWIPVSERLPKIADVYRVTRYYRDNAMNPQYLVDACCFDGSNTWYNDNRINHERAYADNVIAWQENPEPYKVEPQERTEVEDEKN